MKTNERVLKNLNSDRFKWLKKNIAKNEYYSEDQFADDLQRYAKAIKEGRVLCSIGSVSKSGMSRTIKFLECRKGLTRYNYMNFWSLFKVLGYAEARNSRDYFSISGCGMDMIFHTNYTNMHYLQQLGAITKKQCEHLAQQTPTVI